MLRNSEHRPCFRMTGPFRNSLGRRPFLGAPSRLSSDRTGGSVISTLEEKDSYDVGGAKSDGHGGAESSCQKHQIPPEHQKATGWWPFGSRLGGPLIQRHAEFLAQDGFD